MNMSYCRFRNTVADFIDCVNNLRTLDPNDNSLYTREERLARKRLIRAAADLLAELGVEDVYDDIAIEAACAALDVEPC